MVDEGSGMFLALRHPLSPTTSNRTSSLHGTLQPGLLEARFPFSVRVELYCVVTRATCLTIQIILLCYEYVGGRRWLVSFGNLVKKLFWCFMDQDVEVL